MVFNLAHPTINYLTTQPPFCSVISPGSPIKNSTIGILQTVIIALYFDRLHYKHILISIIIIPLFVAEFLLVESVYLFIKSPLNYM